MSSMKRELPASDEPQAKKVRVAESEPSQFAATSGMRVVLNPADCDIDFNVEGDGLKGSALSEEGFAYCWSGARANIGITRGKYCFGCKIVSAQSVDMEDTPLDTQHVCRIGISRGDDTVRNLGETSNSFGFGGTGKFSNSGTFSDYGEKFGVGDTIVCAVDLETGPMASIGFSKNGKWLGVAKHFDGGPSGLRVVGSPIKKMQWESALFPHVLLKNVAVQLQFSIDDGLILVDGYKPWAAAVLDGNSISGPAFSNPSDCEVIMMVGLPASGKTTWAEKWVKEHPEKRYVLLGTNLALEQMKVPGLLRKHNYGERFDRLMDRATKIFNVLLSRASRIPRNFIIDQTNVYKSARRRKLKPFANYIKIAVVVFPRAEELKFRADKRFKEMGKEVPAEAVNEMLANYTLPMSKDMFGTDEYFDQVLFVESGRAESQRLLDEMKRESSVKRGSSLMSCSSSSHKAPVLSYTDITYQNQGVGDRYQSSYSSEPLSRAPYGNLYSIPSTNNSRPDFDYVGSHRGHNFPRINDSQSRLLPTHGSISEFHRNYGVPSLNSQIGVQPCYGSFPNERHPIGGYPHPSPVRPPSLNFPYDGQHVGGYPQPYPSGLPSLNFPNDGQHIGGYRQPYPVRPPPLNFPTDVHPPGLYRPPPQGY